MKSNKCLFNKAIFKSDIKRFLPFTIPLLIVDFIIFPIIIYSQRFNLPNDPITLGDFLGFSMAADIFSFIFAGLFAILMFSYLYKPNMCNAIHALPVGRRGLFVTNFIAGYILLVVPQLIGFLTAYPAIHIASREAGKILLVELVSILADSFIFYSSGVLAVFLAGNIFAGAVLYLLINFAATAIELVVNFVVIRIGIGITADSIGIGILQYSPLSRIIAEKSFFNINSYVDVAAGEKAHTLKDLYAVILIYLAISLVMVAVSYILYKIRKLEVAGDMVAFKILNPIIGVLVAFLGGSLLTLFVSVFIGVEMVGWLIMFVVFSFVVFIVTEMILHKSPKIFTLKNMILWAVFCALTIAAFVLTANYKTNYIPAPSRVKTVKVDINCDITFKDEDEIKKVEKFHRALIENAKKNPSDNSSDFFGIYNDYYDPDDDVGRYNVNVEYTLKDGNYVYRSYSFKETDKELCDMFRELEKNNHPDSIFDEIADIDYTLVSCRYSYDDADGFGKDITVPAEKVQTVFEACKKQSEEDLKNYSSLNSDKLDYSLGSNQGYFVFELKAKDDNSRKKIEEISYFYDPLGWYIEPEYGYFNENDEYEGSVAPEFYVYCYVKKGTPLYDMFSELINAK